MKLFTLLGLATILATIGLGSRPAHSADEADSIVVLVKHTAARPDDPVTIQLEHFKVVKASFDPKKIEGGKATIEIDATSVKSGSAKIDARSQTPDFLDAKKFPTITVTIDKVKKKAGKTFTAEATVTFRDLTKKYPVTFDVVAQTTDSIRVKGEATVSRLDFKIGRDSKDPKLAPVAADVVVKLLLTLKKT